MLKFFKKVLFGVPESVLLTRLKLSPEREKMIKTGKNKRELRLNV